MSAFGKSILLITGHDGKALFVGEVNVRDRLRFHTLRSIDESTGAFAGCERTRNFVGEIDMPRRIEQIQAGIFRPTLRCIASLPGAL
jgi:hypothetical protein